MHAECAWCGDMAMNHRMTKTGNFYCLEFTALENRWARNVYPIITDRRNAAMRAKCNQLKKSPLSSVKVIAETIKEKWLTMNVLAIANEEQLTL